MEGLAALRDLANVFLGRLVLFDVSLAVVLADKLTTAVFACIRPYRLVGVHVRRELGLPEEGAIAQGALEGFRRSTCVRPPV